MTLQCKLSGTSVPAALRLSAGIAVGIVFALAEPGGAAFAATPQTTTFGGPVLTGVCVLNQQAIFTTSKVGVFAGRQYKQMREAAQTAVNGEQAKITADEKALQAQKLPQAQQQQRQQQLAKRYADTRTKAQADSQDLEATRKDVVTKIAAAAQPVIKQVYDQKKCGLLLARSSILAGNSAMDVTAAVIQGLDAKITSIALAKQVAAAKR